MCLRYLNNYKNKWMPVLSVGKIKYMITLHKKISYNFFFYEILHWEIFQAILGKFRGNSDWGLGRISAPNRVQKNHCYYQWRTAQFSPMLLPCSALWAGRDLYGAASYVTRDLGFPSLTQRSATPCGLLQQGRCTEDFFWPRFLWEDLVRFIMLFVPLYGMGHVVIFVSDSMF